MQKLQFTIGRTTKTQFDREMVAKIYAGLDIFKRILNHPLLDEKMLNFGWHDEENNYYHRFHLSNGLSNWQVLNRLRNAASILGEDVNGTTITLAILPCDNRKDIQVYQNLRVAPIWLNMGYLKNEWYTPVHVASCIAHEFCINLGFETHVNARLANYSTFTVPYQLGMLVKEIASSWKMQITDIRASFDFIQNSAYDYFPCSTLFSIRQTNSKQNQYFVLNELLDKTMAEITHLEDLGNLMNDDELIRMEALRDCEKKLLEIKSILQNSSLDGSENYISAQHLVFE